MCQTKITTFLFYNILVPYLPQIQNGPQCFKCIMTGVSWKWLLTFHSMTSLSYLMVTSAAAMLHKNYYILIWLEQSEVCLQGGVKVRGKGQRGRGSVPSVRINHQDCLWRLSEGKKPLTIGSWNLFLASSSDCILGFQQTCLQRNFSQRNALLRPLTSLSCHSSSALKSYSDKRSYYFKTLCRTLCCFARLVACCIHLSNTPFKENPWLNLTSDIIW